MKNAPILPHSEYFSCRSVKKNMAKFLCYTCILSILKALFECFFCKRFLLEIAVLFTS